jgi:hypothetical protein
MRRDGQVHLTRPTLGESLYIVVEDTTVHSSNLMVRWWVQGELPLPRECMQLS